MTKKLKVAAAQIYVGNNISKNLERIIKAINHASANNAEVIVFPECAVTGYPPFEKQHPLSMDKNAIARALMEICTAAKKKQINVIVGSISFKGRNAYNTAYAINLNGQITATYNKVQLVKGADGDEPYFCPGNNFVTFNIKGIKCSMLICLDARYPEIYRFLANNKVRVVFQLFYGAGNNCSWKIPVLEGTLRCRAAENGIFIVASNVSRRQQMVVSRICDPNGISLANAKYGREEIIFAELDLNITGGGFRETQRSDLLKVIPVSNSLLNNKSYLH